MRARLSFRPYALLFPPYALRHQLLLALETSPLDSVAKDSYFQHMNASHAPLEELQPEQDLSLSRLIVVSNREPYEHRLVKNHLIWERTSGGLISALDPVMRRLGGTWIAWGSGKADREVVDQDMIVEVPPDAPTYHLRRVWLEATEIKGGYQGYANQVLWPLCHLTLDRVAYRKAFGMRTRP
jgi:hypothetical protein